LFFDIEEGDEEGENILFARFLLEVGLDLSREPFERVRDTISSFGVDSLDDPRSTLEKGIEVECFPNLVIGFSAVEVGFVACNKEGSVGFH